MDPLRTAVRQGFGSNFFDLQANAFLHGRLSVPNGSLGIEGFVVGGKTYMYFPPFPALLRIPVMLVSHEFDGRLTLLSMALAWVVFATMTAKLYWLVRHCVRGAGALSRTEATYSAVFLVAATGGTVLVFDASLPWVYHEVYLWSAALVVGAAYWMIRVSLEPSPRAVGWMFAFALCAILTRTPSGWALCLGMILIGVRLLIARRHREMRSDGWVVVAAGLVALLIGAGVNYAKFRHPYLFPLQDQVWTSVNPHRREALAHDGGTLTGVRFLPTTIVNYFRPDGIRFVPYFPYITLPAHPAQAYAGAFLDQSYRTGSIPAFMPLPLLLSLLGIGYTLRRRLTSAQRALRVPLFATLVAFIGVMDYGYITYRYTSDAVPFLIVGGAIGACALSQLLAARSRRIRLAPLVPVAALAGFGVLANMATGYALATQTWAGGKLVEYVRVQHDLSALTGNPQRQLVTHSDVVPQGPGRTDELRIVGSCEGLYLNTGDQYQPWVVVEQRDRFAQIQLGDGPLRDGSVSLYGQSGPHIRQIALQIQARTEQARIVVTGVDLPTAAGPWFDIAQGHGIVLMLRPQTDTASVELYSSPGGIVGEIPLSDWDSDWISHIDEIQPTNNPNALGVSVTYGWGPQPTLCHRLAASAGIQLP